MTARGEATLYEFDVKVSRPSDNRSEWGGKMPLTLDMTGRGDQFTLASVLHALDEQLSPGVTVKVSVETVVREVRE